MLRPVGTGFGVAMSQIQEMYISLLPLVLLAAVITAEVMSDFLQNLVQLDG